MLNELEALWLAYEACADEKEKEAIMETINATMEYFDDYSRESGAWEARSIGLRSFQFEAFRSSRGRLSV